MRRFCKAITNEDGFIRTGHVERKATDNFIFLQFYKIKNTFSKIKKILLRLMITPKEHLRHVGDFFLRLTFPFSILDAFLNLCSFTKTSKNRLFSLFQSK